MKHLLLAIRYLLAITIAVVLIVFGAALAGHALGEVLIRYGWVRL